MLSRRHKHAMNTVFIEPYFTFWSALKEIFSWNTPTPINIHWFRHSCSSQKPFYLEWWTIWQVLLHETQSLHLSSTSPSKSSAFALYIHLFHFAAHFFRSSTPPNLTQFHGNDWMHIAKWSLYHQQQQQPQLNIININVDIRCWLFTWSDALVMHSFVLPFIMA